MIRWFVDTSAWFAFANRRDPDHAAVAAAIRTPRLRLVTSSFVLDETITLTRMRLGHPVALRVGTILRDPASVDLIRLTATDEDDAWGLFGRRADQTYSFTDCTSFVLMRRLGLDTALSLDADFAREGFTTKP